MLIFSALVFTSVSMALIGLYAWLTPNRTQQRLRDLSVDAEKDDWIESVVNAMGPFAKLSTPTGDWESSPLRTRFITAGIRNRNAPTIFFGAKTLLPLVSAFGMFMLLSYSTQTSGNTLIFFVIVAALIGCYLPNVVLATIIRRRKREIFENFPDAADLMLVCVEAGLGLDAGLSRVAEEIKIKSMVLAEELHLTNLEMRAGATREKSLRNLALRTGIEEIGTFATMLVQADKFGTSIGDSLRVFSEDLRQKRQVRAEELAAKVPTKMLVPLVLFIFPSIIMVILGPALIQILRVILPMVAGGK